MGNAITSPVYCAPKIFRISASGPEEDEEIEDPVERMLKKTGCLEQHYSVQECIAETKDWRQCQNQVKVFRECMAKYQQQQGARLSK